MIDYDNFLDKGWIMKGLGSNSLLWNLSGWEKVDLEIYSDQ